MLLETRKEDEYRERKVRMSKVCQEIKKKVCQHRRKNNEETSKTRKNEKGVTSDRVTYIKRECRHTT